MNRSRYRRRPARLRLAQTAGLALLCASFAALLLMRAFGRGGLTLGEGSRGEGDRFAYQGMPEGFDFPAEDYRLQGYLLDGDQRAIRRHAWNLWAGLTSPSDSVVDGQRVPIFSTWYSIPEVYNSAGRASAVRRPYARPHPPTQSAIARGGNPEDRLLGPAAGLMSFVKFDQEAADFIWQNRYHLRSTLTKLGQRFDAQATPTVERSIKPFPRKAMALKLVFWLVKNPDSPQSEHGLTALPIWDPDALPPPGGEPPMYTTWQSGVAVDPAGRYPAGSRQRVNVNGTLSKPRYVMAEVVPLSRFYAHTLTNPEDVADARIFMNMHSSAQDEQERFITNPGQTPELDDTIVLLAMHVTTKEIDSWTFQTFWWSPHPNEGRFARDRTPNVKPPFTNYLMCAAYSTVTPKEPEGTPPICFNPYLETDLGPTKPYRFRGVTYPPDPMAGTRSNCMNCHRLAGFPAIQPDNPGAASLGRVFNDGYRSPADPYFDRLVKTDFLWSIALKSVDDGKTSRPR
jgi:hypothetical protein